MPRLLLVAVTFAFTTVCPFVSAQTERASRIEPRLMLRVSHNLLEELVPAELTQTFDFDTTVESTRFLGSGLAAGSIDVQLQPSDFGSTFTVEIRGKTTMRFSGSQDPIRFIASCHGPFLTTTRIDFDGRRFQQENSSSWSHARTDVHRLCSKQKGLIGKLVRNIGWKKVCEARPKMDQYIGKRIETRTTNAMDAVVQELTSELNALVAEEVTTTLTKLDSEAKNWHWQLSANEGYLQATIGPQAKRPTPIDPVTRAKLQTDIEIWVRLSTQEATLLGLSTIWSDSRSLLRSLLDEEERKLLPPDSGLRSVGNWAVIAIGRVNAKDSE